MTKVEDYLLSNLLTQNITETKLMVISKDKNLKEQIKYPTRDKQGEHSHHQTPRAHLYTRDCP